MNLMDVNREFRTEEDRLEKLEKVRWQDSVPCLTCGSKDVIAATTSGMGKSND